MYTCCLTLHRKIPNFNDLERGDWKTLWEREKTFRNVSLLVKVPVSPLANLLHDKVDCYKKYI